MSGTQHFSAWRSTAAARKENMKLAGLRLRPADPVAADAAFDKVRQVLSKILHNVGVFGKFRGKNVSQQAGDADRS